MNGQRYCDVVESYAIVTTTAGAHPQLRQMHKPDSKLQLHEQDKRSIIAIHHAQSDAGL